MGPFATHRRCESLLIPLFCLVLLVVADADARSQEMSAEGLYRQALAKHKYADFEGSLELLEKAARKTEEPVLLGKIQLQIGVSHAIMGKQRPATRAFRAALTHDPLLRLDPAQTKPSVTDLFNSVKVRYEMPEKAAAKVKANPGDQTASTSTSRPPRVVASQRVSQREPRVRGRGLGRRDGDGRGHRLWTWVAAGAAVTSLGVAVGLGVSARADHAAFQDELEPTRQDELERSGRDKALAANVLFGMSGALAITSVVLFFVEKPGSKEERRANAPRALVVAPALGSAPGLVMRGSF